MPQLHHIHYRDPGFPNGERRSGGFNTPEEAAAQAADEIACGYLTPENFLGIFPAEIADQPTEERTVTVIREEAAESTPADPIIEVGKEMQAERAAQAAEAQQGSIEEIAKAAGFDTVDDLIRTVQEASNASS